MYKPGPRLIYSGLVIIEQPYRKQEPGNHLHEHKHTVHQHFSEYTYLHINRRYTGGNPRGCRPPKAKLIGNTGLAT